MELSACSLTFWKNLDLFGPLGFDIQRYAVHETTNIKLYSVRAFKRYLNEKRGRETATISKFSALGFETYFNTFWILHCSPYDPRNHNIYDPSEIAKARILEGKGRERNEVRRTPFE